MGLGSRQRVIDALEHRIPDKVPYVHQIITNGIRKEIAAMGGYDLHYDFIPEVNYAPIAKLGEMPVMEPNINNGPEVAEVLGLDSIDMNMMPPFWVETKPDNGGVAVLDGLLMEPDTLDGVIFPNPDDYMKPLEELVRRYKGEYAIGVVSRLGVSWMLNCVGLLPFSINLIEEPEFLHALLDKYEAWCIRLIDNCQEAGADFMKFADDLAFNTNTMFSPATWDELFKPHLEREVSHLRVPWIWHSDGNVMALLGKIADLGANGFNPIEPGAMDEEALRAKFGERLCLVGNVKMDHILTDATREEVFEAVKNCIDFYGPGGNFIITDSNSIVDYLNPRNVKWMSEAVHEYRNIY